jgi:hypothetical protein
MKSNRRSFLSKLSIGFFAFPGFSSFKYKQTERQLKNIFIHHVYFWLKNPHSIEDRNKLAEGLLKLSEVKTIQKFHIGKPADTNRDVIERGYALSWFVEFRNATEQASYQTDPIHLKFIEDYSHLWSKVIVYDSVDI